MQYTRGLQRIYTIVVLRMFFRVSDAVTLNISIVF